MQRLGFLVDCPLQTGLEAEDSQPTVFPGNLSGVLMSWLIARMNNALGAQEGEIVMVKKSQSRFMMGIPADHCSLSSKEQARKCKQSRCYAQSPGHGDNRIAATGSRGALQVLIPCCFHGYYI